MTTPTDPEIPGTLHSPAPSILDIAESLTEPDRPMRAVGFERYLAEAWLVDRAELDVLRRLHEEATANAARYRTALEAIVEVADEGILVDLINAANAAREALR